ncbi:mitochondrial inner membrane protease subunit 1 [Obelidium mucronatum]|nr:mitochondrial inner membrane protease subunit 1 [Obelidium mucronatum]
MSLRRTALVASQTLCVVLLFHRHVGEATACEGPSMLPTLNAAGDWVLVAAVAPARKQSLRVGDVVAARSPLHANRAVCKRVLGVPGDVVLRDPSVSLETVRVPPGHVWLQGDNLSHSIDSRTYGPLPMGLIKGKVVCKLWPPFTKL